MAVNASQVALGKLFDTIEHFFRRLEVYTKIPPIAGLTDIIVDIMVAVLSVLALATKEIKRGKLSEYFWEWAVSSDLLVLRKAPEEVIGKNRDRGCSWIAEQTNAK